MAFAWDGRRYGSKPHHLCVFGTCGTVVGTFVTYSEGYEISKNCRNKNRWNSVSYLNPRYDSGRTHPYHPIMRPLIFVVIRSRESHRSMIRLALQSLHNNILKTRGAQGRGSCYGPVAHAISRPRRLSA